MNKPICQYCKKELSGRSDKKFCDAHCKSALQYQERKNNEMLYFEIDRQLKTNRKVLKKYNRMGKTILRKSDLENEGFNPSFFTHYWKNKKNEVYLFCYEFGFMSLKDNNKDKFLLVQWQDYMKF